MLPAQSLKVQVWYLVTFWCRKAGIFFVIYTPEWVVELLEGQIRHFHSKYSWTLGLTVTSSVRDNRFIL